MTRNISAFKIRNVWRRYEARILCKPISTILATNGAISELHSKTLENFIQLRHSTSAKLRNNVLLHTTLYNLEAKSVPMHATKALGGEEV
jgi:hypothetical protein